MLVAFLFEWRTALISLIAIPLSLMAAVSCSTARGATINTMVLAGLVIAVGVVVDDAIIDIENIWRRLREHAREGSDDSIAKVILDASLEVRSAIVYATLIIVAGLVPVFFLTGSRERSSEPLVLSYGARGAGLDARGADDHAGAVLAPAVARAPLERRDRRSCAWLKRGYAWCSSRVIHRPRPALRSWSPDASLAGVARRAAPRASRSCPTFKERDFLDALDHQARHLAHGGDADRSTAASSDLQAIPGVQHSGTHIGQAFLAEEIAGVNFGENWISIDPYADYDKTLAAIQEVVDRYPGLYPRRADLSQRADRRGARRRERADRRAHLRQRPRRASRAGGRGASDDLGHRRASVDAHVEFQEDVPQIEVKVKLARSPTLRPQAGRRAPRRGDVHGR